MEISIQPVQVLSLVIYIIGFVALWKIKSPGFRMMIVGIMLIIFAVNPIRFKQEGGESLERSVTRFDSIPEKWESNQPTFEQMQIEERQTLIKESKGYKNETLN